METIKINQSSIESFNHDKHVVGITQKQMEANNTRVLNNATCALSEIERNIHMMKATGNYDAHRFEWIEANLYDFINDFNTLAQKYYLADGYRFSLSIIKTEKK